MFWNERKYFAIIGLTRCEFCENYEHKTKEKCCRAKETHGNVHAFSGNTNLFQTKSFLLGFYIEWTHLLANILEAHFVTTHEVHRTIPLNLFSLACESVCVEWVLFFEMQAKIIGTIFNIRIEETICTSSMQVDSYVQKCVQKKCSYILIAFQLLLVDKTDLCDGWGFYGVDHLLLALLCFRCNNLQFDDFNRIKYKTHRYLLNNIVDDYFLPWNIRNMYIICIYMYCCLVASCTKWVWLLCDFNDFSVNEMVCLPISTFDIVRWSYLIIVT